MAPCKARPIVLKRFVNGASGEAFYQKRAPANKPAWLGSVVLSFPSGRTAEEAPRVQAVTTSPQLWPALALAVRC